MELSIIIPFKDENQRIGSSLAVIRDFFNKTTFEYELILVDDGSTDTAVEEVVKPLLIDQRIKLVQHTKNLGKGAAIASGVAVSSGEYVFFTDADLSTPISEFPKLYEKRACKIVIGVRTNSAFVMTKQPVYRMILGKLGNFIIRMILGLTYKDTQCGFKLLRGDLAKSFFSKLVIKRWGFDFDILYQAKQSGVIAAEVPVLWGHYGKSKLIPVVDHLRSLWELLYFRVWYFFKK